MAVFDDLIAAASPVLIERNLHRQQGGSWEIRQYLTVYGAPMEWPAGCAPSCQIRDSTGNKVFQFSNFTLATGLLTMTASLAETTAIKPGTYSYDVDIVNGAKRLPFMRGSFRVASQVTV